MLKKLSMIMSAALLAAGSSNAASVSLGVTDAFAQLGASCGGIRQQDFATGFDAAGNVAGYVYLATTCSTGGRGSRPRTYSKWLAVTWNLSGVAIEEMASVPATDPSAGGTRGAGGTNYPDCVPLTLNDWTCYSVPVTESVSSGVYSIQDTLHIINQAACSATNTAYCAYRAFLGTP